MERGDRWLLRRFVDRAARLRAARTRSRDCAMRGSLVGDIPGDGAVVRPYRQQRDDIVVDRCCRFSRNDYIRPDCVDMAGYERLVAACGDIATWQFGAYVADPRSEHDTTIIAAALQLLAVRLGRCGRLSVLWRRAECMDIGRGNDHHRVRHLRVAP